MNGDNASRPFKPLPLQGAWLLQGAHDGFEIAQFAANNDGMTFTGRSLGVEGGKPWSFNYTIELDGSWHARKAVIRNEAGDQVDIQTDGKGSWTIDGKSRPELDGCLDIDLEGSAVTNAAPIRRLALAEGQQVEAPAVYVRTEKLRVERLEQTYRRADDADELFVFDYASPRFEYHDDLKFGPDGLIVDYPAVARRVL